MRPNPLRTFALAAGLLLFVSTPAFAEHFEIELTIDKDKARSSVDLSPPPQGHNPRPVLHAKKGEPLVLQFFVTSNFPHDTIKNVTIRYFIVPEQKAGQSEIPRSGDDAILHGHFILDFKPNTGKVGLRQQLHIDHPGTYLVRVQSENSDADHEHMSGIDVVVE